MIELEPSVAFGEFGNGFNASRGDSAKDEGDVVLVSGFGLVAGMAVEAVRQLQLSNPDPEYQRGRRSGGRGGQGRPRG